MSDTLERLRERPQLFDELRLTLAEIAEKGDSGEWDGRRCAIEVRFLLNMLASLDSGETQE